MLLMIRYSMGLVGMLVMDDDLEVEILSYREFRNRQTLKAWRQRQRIYERQQLTERRREDIEDRASERYSSARHLQPPRPTSPNLTS
jgi:hypothetical protein